MKNEEILLSSQKARLDSFQTPEKGRNFSDYHGSQRVEGEKRPKKKKKKGFEKQGEAVCPCAKERGYAWTQREISKYFK